VIRQHGLLAAGHPLIGRKPAQRIARHELAEVSIVQRIENWIARLLGGAADAVPMGWFGLVVLIVVIAVVAIIVIYWTRPGGPTRRAAAPVLADLPRTAREYRGAAERLAAAGDYGGAIVERVRAIAAEIDERGLLARRPGRTAGELAVEAGRALPAIAPDVTAAMRLFDDIHYGDRPGTEPGYALVCRVDAAVMSAPARHADDTRRDFAGLGLPR
jgi:hypothetical protein